MDLNSALNICQTCLSLDRQLYPLTNFPPLIQLNFLPTTTRMCWECGNIVLKFSNFITKTVTAQRILMDVQHNDDIICLSTLEYSTQQPFFEFEHIDDPLSHDSEETVSVKEEVSSSDIENDIFHKDTEQLNTLDDVKDNSEKDLIKDENDDNNTLESEINFNVDIKTEGDKDKPEITFTKKGKPLLDADDRFLDVSEEVMKKILVTELSDEEVMKKREQKRCHRRFQNMRYKCHFCILGFTTEENLNVHIRRKHKHIDYNNVNAPGNEITDCEICKLRFKTKYLAQKHRERHYIHYECRLCQYRAYELSVIVAHCKRYHDNETVGQTRCNLCAEVSATPEEYLEHWKTEHSSCEICGYGARTKGTLRKHMRRMHSQRLKLICDHCSRSFKSKLQLEMHMTSHDANIAKILSYCEVCKIQFKRIYYYRTHLKTSANHVKERHQCSVCGKQFVTDFYRRRHYKFYHLKKSEHKCDQCDKMFITEWRLKNHQRVHHGLKKPRNHECNDCGKKFYDRAVLNSHYLIHSDLRPYMCSECGDTFKHSGALYTHTKLVHRLGKKLFKKQKNFNK